MNDAYHRVQHTPAITLLVSPTCELHVGWHGPSLPAFCDVPATHWYPTDDGGTMALCAEHAHQQPHATRIADDLAPTTTCGVVDAGVTCDRVPKHTGDHCGSTPDGHTRIWT